MVIFGDDFDRQDLAGGEELLSSPRLRPAVVVVQLLSCVQLFVIPWTTARQAPLSSTISQSLLKFMSTEPVMLSNHLILCHLLLFLPRIFPRIRVFSNESALCINILHCKILLPQIKDYPIQDVSSTEVEKLQIKSRLLLNEWTQNLSLWSRQDEQRLL